jgi:Divergent InlB B-repeat domain
MPWRCLEAVVAILLIAVATGAQALSPETNKLVMDSFPLNPYVQVLDGQWLGCKVASDGNCYFGSSTHDNRHGAAFFRYNPTLKVLTMITNDLTLVCGENPTLTPPQGKLHSDIVEADGWLYFSTHLGNYWTEGEAAYTGGHVIGYELATGKFRDFGVVRSNYTSYAAVGVDRVRNKILCYVTQWWWPTLDSHMYRIDIATGTKQDLGVVPGLNSFYFFMDSRGDGWFSCPSDNGSLRVMRSATGQIQTYANVLPESQLGNTRWWDWAQPLPSGNRCVCKLQGGNYLYIFDADALQTNGPNAFVTLRNTGPMESGLALANDRVYYMQRANRQPGNQEYTDFHLMSAPIFANTPIIDHGLVMDQSGRLVWRLPGMAADGSGRLYVVGDWWLLPGEQGTSVGTLRHVDDPGTNYTALPRGEFFAVKDFSQSPTLIAPRRLSLTTRGGGAVAMDSPTNFFLGNAVVNLTATPSNGWNFFGWAGDINGTDTTNSIVMTRDKAVQAVFRTSLNTSIVGHGTVALDPPGGIYPSGTTVRIMALPDNGYYFLQWSGATNGSANPLFYSIARPASSITATFSPLSNDRRTLTTIVNGKGTVVAQPQQNSYPIGEKVTLGAFPEHGQVFLGWGGEATGTNTSLIISLDTNKTVIANFTTKPELTIQRFPERIGNQSWELGFHGELNGSYRIDLSTNLVDWVPLGTFTNQFGDFQFTDPSDVGGNSDYQFYRAVHF